MTTAFIAGLATPTGAYLARLLRARQTRVSGDATDMSRAEALLAALGAEDVELRSSALDGPAPDVAYLLDSRLDVTAASAAWQTTRFCVAVAPGGDNEAIARVRARGGFAAAARLFGHASRLDSTFDGALGVCAAMRDGATVSSGDLDTLRDLGWTPEYVDALWRIAHAPRAADYDVATGIGMTLREVARHAAGYFGVEADRLLPPPASPAPARLGDPAGLTAATGWRAYTHGRDLVVALCEGLPTR